MINDQLDHLRPLEVVSGLLSIWVDEPQDHEDKRNEIESHGSKGAESSEDGQDLESSHGWDADAALSLVIALNLGETVGTSFVLDVDLVRVNLTILWVGIHIFLINNYN